MVSQLDSPQPSSRLFSGPLTAPGASFAPLPADLFAGGGGSRGGVKTQFVALGFKCATQGRCCPPVELISFV